VDRQFAVEHRQPDDEFRDRVADLRAHPLVGGGRRAGTRPRRPDHAPARRTFLPRLLPADQLPGALALDMLSFHASLTVGPLLAGMLVATGGFQLCYLVDVVSFAAALYGLARLPPMPPLGDAARPGLKAVAEGLRFIRHKPVLLGVFLADVNATVLGMPFALFPALNDQNFGVGSGAPELGNFRAGVVGSLATPAVSAISGGLATVLGAGLLRLAVPALARYDARDPDKH
jgi:MFS family permease